MELQPMSSGDVSALARLDDSFINAFVISDITCEDSMRIWKEAFNQSLFHKTKA